MARDSKTVRERCGTAERNAATLALGMMVEGAAQAWVVTGLEPFERPLELPRVCTRITDIWCRVIYLEPDAPMPAP
jgi:hypothetical protein